MIKANELRIGNLVRRVIPEHDAPYYAHDDCKRSEYIIRVQCILPAGVNLTEANKIEYHYEDAFGYIEGIPLTPEWLERCGIERHERGHYLIGEQFALIKNDLKDESGNIEGFILLGKGNHGLVTKPHIKRLHQLQNLYFALTGEELNVKL